MAEKIIFCPNCNQELEIPEEYLGTEVECPLCQHKFLTIETIDVQCPACGTGKSVSSFKAGENTGCYRCGAIFTAASPAVLISPPIGKPVPFTPRELPETAIKLSEEEIHKFRYKLNKFFCKRIKKRGVWVIFSCILNIVDFGWIIDIIRAIVEAVESRKDIQIWDMFQQIQNIDQNYLTDLDVLPTFGKTSSQLAAPSYTLFSPVIDDEVDDALYEFVDANEEDQDIVDEENPDILVYSLEQVTKIYTFEHQLFIYQAYWDYRTATLFDESTEAFFFKDITDIATQNEYENVRVKVEAKNEKKENKFWKAVKKNKILSFVVFGVIPCIIAFIGAEIGSGIGGKLVSRLWFYGSWIGYYILFGIFALCWSNISQLYHKLLSSYDIIKKIKLSETFTITASSVRSTGMTILCDEWIEANNGKFDGRTDGEKIIHAIRKMIEEKKVSVNE